MVTVINNPDPRSTKEERTIIERTSSDGAGWAVALIILLAVIAVGGYLLFRYYRAAPAQPQTPGANVEINLPAGGGNTNQNGQGGGEPQY